jgi:Cu/Ag efflux protein CusF
MKTNAFLFAATVALLASTGSVDASHLEGHPGDQPMADAEVRKVDLAAKKITLKHGEIRNLDMPPMTMVFQMRDPAMLGTLKVGDKVKFSADKVNGAYVVTAIEPAR